MEVPAVAEPTTTDTVDGVVAPVLTLGIGNLLPQADHVSATFVDHKVLIRVLPAFEALHLEAESDFANLLAPHRHEILLGTVVPPVRGVLGVHVRQRFPITGGFGLLVRLDPALDHLVELCAVETRHLNFLPRVLEFAAINRQSAVISRQFSGRRSGST
ncbi:hypothetical protein QV65_17655 [Rhodococcus erythropolis]|nr:hypothetical protein QV65_17655 [Rhodococcus erythropolis]